MSEKAPLGDYSQHTPPADSLFFAIFPDRRTAERIATLANRLRRDLALAGLPLKTERFHISLHHLGVYAGLPKNLVDAACEAASAVDARVFKAAFDYAMSFKVKKPRNRPLVLLGDDGVVGIEALRQKISVEMMKVGLRRWAASSFTPHMTLLYDDHLVGERPIETVEWTVREFVLVHSLVGQTKYIPIARWPLKV